MVNVGLGSSVFFSLSLMSIVFLFVIRGTLMVAVTEFVAGSRSKPFSSLEANKLIEFELGFGGGEIVKVAEIF